MKFESKGLISIEIDGKVYDYKLYQSLESLSRTRSQRKSAKELGISHTVFNRRLLKAEDKLGVKITRKVGNGTLLTPDGDALLEEFKKYMIQIEKTPDINIAGGHISTGLLESIHTPFNTNIYSSSDEDAFELAKRGAVDILTLDDPLIAYERDINFMPIAYDYLVLVSSPESKSIESISDLEGLDFVNVNGSAQRLAWNSLNHYDIEYNIKESVNSQFDAFKIVRNSKNLYTFLNASYFKGNDLLKYDTQHVISVIKVNEDKAEVDEYVRFLINEGQRLIEQQGFTPMG
ncbi:MAG: LysR family transcriptional regulator [Methanobrevibacter sp.]|jgi:DNA-binding transcriptional LysR family regulator|uniref:LysR family transcriptional regulator n=1 Tax=Methanobrevibacter thaueri TaxID=190975 RepID=UPI002584C2C6|nr:LysR family transcriptional regulator [uncultured Methanobrevibacter sp.]MBR3197907.1 LysR family transcriptional regulator [Methanobrevibacter sp.]MBR7050413.1 LysR family transcriptional regulator [Methanobrevibacter sp.]